VETNNKRTSLRVCEADAAIPNSKLKHDLSNYRPSKAYHYQKALFPANGRNKYELAVKGPKTGKKRKRKRQLSDDSGLNGKK